MQACLLRSCCAAMRKNTVSIRIKNDSVVGETQHRFRTKTSLAVEARIFVGALFLFFPGMMTTRRIRLVYPSDCNLTKGICVAS